MLSHKVAIYFSPKAMPCLLTRQAWANIVTLKHLKGQVKNKYDATIFIKTVHAYHISYIKIRKQDKEYRSFLKEYNVDYKEEYLWND